jgi:hypothetical protein
VSSRVSSLSFVFFVIVEDRVQGVLAEVAAADEPFVVLFDHDTGGELDQGAVVGKDPDDVGAAADLAVEPLERVGRAELAVVVGREGVEGEPSAAARAACPSASPNKWTVRRCQGQPSIWPIAFFSPACASEATSWTPVRPRSARPRRKLRHLPR